MVEIYSTETLTTDEEKREILKRKQDYDQAYALWLSGKGPEPNEVDADREEKVVSFPNKKPDADQERKVA